METGNETGRIKGFSLVEMLIVLVIILILAAIILPNYIGGGKRADGTTVKAPITVAKDSVCQQNIRQVRQAIQAFIAADPEGKLPQSLSDIREVAPISRCEVGKEPYVYDPQTGQVRCQHSGHGSY
jgi:prepilin-type N-terminal cleavage/methylation domain-containing protein